MEKKITNQKLKAKIEQIILESKNSYSYRDLLIWSLCFKQCSIRYVYEFVKKGFLGFSEKDMYITFLVKFNIKTEELKKVINAKDLISVQEKKDSDIDFGIILNEAKKIFCEASALAKEIKSMIENKKLETSELFAITIFDSETKQRVTEIFKNSTTIWKYDECLYEKLQSFFPENYGHKKSVKYLNSAFPKEEMMEAHFFDDRLLRHYVDGKDFSFPFICFNYFLIFKSYSQEILPTIRYGLKIELELINIIPYHNDNFAIIVGKTSFGEIIQFTDTEYFCYKSFYVIGEKFYFNLAAMTYSWQIRKAESIVLEGESALNHYKKINESPLYDEKGNVCPVEIKTDFLHMFNNFNKEEPDNYEVVCPVERLRDVNVDEFEFYLFDMNFACRNEINDEEFRIPCYAQKSQCSEQLKKDDSFVGNVWLQGHLDESLYTNLTITKQDNQTVRLEVEVAENELEQNKGFTNRFYIPEGTGMFYIFEFERVCSFVTVGVGVPLSVAYIKSNGQISEIIDREADDSKIYHNKESVKYVLEVPQGWFSKNGIKEGDFVKYDALYFMFGNHVFIK